MSGDQHGFTGYDPFGVMKTWQTVQRAWIQHPKELQEQWKEWVRGTGLVSMYAWQRAMGVECEDPILPRAKDARFKHSSWTENLYYDWLKEQYLFSSSWIIEAVEQTPDVDSKTRELMKFWAHQIVSAMSPSNFFLTNPEAQEKAKLTAGRSLLDAAQLLAEDMQEGDITMVNKRNFVVGKTLATTPGKVVYRNALMELIQYAPQTPTVYEKPIVYVPHWINKYYVVDLQPHNSMINYLVQQGFTVFVISWKNVTKEQSDVRFDDYVEQGIHEAVSAARDITGAEQVNAIGYCIGGTALTIYMAWMNRRLKKGEKAPVGAWNLFASLVDFSRPGEIENFVNEDVLKYVNRVLERDGVMDGAKMNTTFRMLRPNFLIWNYFASKYLCGERPKDWDVLYWNMDPTRLPAAMHSYYLREFYVNNKVVQKDALTIAGQKIDLSCITQPLYAVTTEEDHITPWRECFKISRYVSAPVRQVVASSGHILGIVIPPEAAANRHYRVGDSTHQGDPDAWFKSQQTLQGSWWEDWVQWLPLHSGERTKPPTMGSKKYRALVDAPGTYVLET